MSFEKFTKVWNSLLQSSLWVSTDSDTKVVWITLLLMADLDGIVHAAIPGIAHLAGVPVERTAEILEFFQRPDNWSRSEDHDGRRIKKQGRDWIILNYKEYKDKMASESIKASKREYWHRNKERFRQKDDNFNDSEPARKMLDTCEKTRTRDRDRDRDKHTEVRTVLPSQDFPEESYNSTYCPSGDGPPTYLDQKKEPNTPSPMVQNVDYVPRYNHSFDSFWTSYPRRKAKRKAQTAFERAQKREPDISVFLAAIERQKKWRAWQEGFIPLPATWLNGDRWLDEESTQANKTKRPKFLNEEE